MPSGSRPFRWVRVNLGMCIWWSAQPEWPNAELFLPGAKRGGSQEQTNQFQIKYMPIQNGSHLLKPVQSCTGGMSALAHFSQTWIFELVKVLNSIHFEESHWYKLSCKLKTCGDPRMSDSLPKIQDGLLKFLKYFFIYFQKEAISTSLLKSRNCFYVICILPY